MGDGQQRARPPSSAASFFTLDQPKDAFFEQPAPGPVVEAENSVA